MHQGSRLFMPCHACPSEVFFFSFGLSERQLSVGRALPLYLCLLDWSGGFLLV